MVESTSDRIVIVGGGQAGLQAAVSLRQSKFAGEIDLFCAENELPYQRPPLSKDYLKGDMGKERLYFRPNDFFEKQNVNVHLGEAVTRLDREAREVETAHGAKYSYTKLLLCTGAPPRKLNCPGADLNGIYYLRTLDDSDALRSVLSASGPVAVVGAGYIGLEVAAVLRSRGKSVTVFEAADRVLARVAGKPVSDFYDKRHREAGVDLRLAVSVAGFEGDGDISAVVLGNGERVACSAALVGIGAVPETELAHKAGLQVENGVVVDDHARTSDANIWAAGDCTNFPSPRYARRLRLESVPNAIEQAKAAASNMAGGDVVYDSLPWFWSNQYDVKLQSAGLSEGHDETVLRGDPDRSVFSVWYYREGRLIAVDTVNDPATFMLSKKLLAGNVSPDATAIADTGFDLKSLVGR